MMRFKEVTRDHVVLEVSEQLVRQDYDLVLPRLERLMSTGAGKLDVLLDLHDFKGWNPPALGHQEHFELKRRHRVGKVAIVGPRACEDAGLRIAKPLFSGELRFFPSSNRSSGLQHALEWLGQGDGNA